MSTPMAASFAGILQQLVEDGWIAGSNEATSPTNLSDIKPQWSTLPSTNLLLSEGFYAIWSIAEVIDGFVNISNC